MLRLKVKADAYPWLNAAAGASESFEHIGSDTIQRVNAEFALRRRQFKKVKLRWQVSRGARRSLGWIPFKAVGIDAGAPRARRESSMLQSSPVPKHGVGGQVLPGIS
jgi:hypothetical protein